MSRGWQKDQNYVLQPKVLGLRLLDKTSTTNRLQISSPTDLERVIQDLCVTYASL